MRRTPPTPRCADCGYPLRELAGPRCPECGRPFDLGDPSTYSIGRRLLAPPLAYVIGVPPLAGALFVAYLHCFGVIFDNPAAPLVPKLVVWILSFPLVYLSMLGGGWAFDSTVAFSCLLGVDVVLWAAGLITVASMAYNRWFRSRLRRRACLEASVLSATDDAE